MILNMIKYGILFLSLFVVGSVQAADHLPPSIERNNSKFEQCNSFTLRYGFVIKIAQIGYYAPDCMAASSILNQDNKIVRFHYFKNVEANFFKESAEEYFLMNLANQEVLQTELKAPLMAFNAGYTDIADGEYFDLVHTDGTNLSLYRNNMLLTNSDNKQFASAYFNIWFGDKPVIEKLRKAFTTCNADIMTC